jgi:recombination associated protein RdgC
MGLLKGGLTARRFRVVGDLPAGWRTTFREQLEAMAFRQPPQRTDHAEVEGWVQVHNLLDTDFSDPNTWLIGEYALFSLRIDKKSLPNNLLRATVEMEGRKWAAERNVSRVPAAVKREIKERLTAEWLERQLPRVSVSTLCWKVTEGWLALDSLSEGTAERVRKRFHRTFGLELVPLSPLDGLRDASLVNDLLATTPIATGGTL